MGAADLLLDAPGQLLLRSYGQNFERKQLHLEDKRAVGGNTLPAFLTVGVFGGQS